MDKRNNLDDVENRKNLMITADLNDKLRRDLLVIFFSNILLFNKNLI